MYAKLQALLSEKQAEEKKLNDNIIELAECMEILPLFDSLIDSVLSYIHILNSITLDLKSAILIDEKPILSEQIEAKNTQFYGFQSVAEELKNDVNSRKSNLDRDIENNKTRIASLKSQIASVRAAIRIMELEQSNLQNNI